MTASSTYADADAITTQDLATADSSHYPNYRKRQVHADFYHEKGHIHKKQHAICQNVACDTIEFVDSSYPASNAWNASNDATTGGSTGFPEVEMNSAEFELNQLVTESILAATRPVQAAVAEDIWPFVDVPEEHQPPSSVLRDLDTLSNSTSATKFDPSLQFSPPNSNSPVPADSFDCGNEAGDEISWDHVSSQLHHPYIEQAMDNVRNTQVLAHDTQPLSMPQMKAPSSALSPPAGLLLRPYKTWFHIREMLEAKQSMYKNQPTVIFELFARVVRTQRQNFEKRQIFQLRDLFKINPPYMPGVLVN
ncbi:hypothetical protein NLG97_g6047 [Lecanicillium saksenae]|uniref:Uncharacterized protein n=1 Tax=Lecanicillium saksenae TaxID=468837 RepID=A0ACC1QQR6_9HYPO|nr:hypothetical protein NLG97_g6047 [Lecanicillium saksenae]